MEEDACWEPGLQPGALGSSRYPQAPPVNPSFPCPQGEMKLFFPRPLSLSLPLPLFVGILLNDLDSISPLNTEHVVTLLFRFLKHINGQTDN